MVATAWSGAKLGANGHARASLKFVHVLEDGGEVGDAAETA